MNNIAKIGIGVSAIALLAILGTRLKEKATQWADKITVKVQGVGKPSMASGILTLPIKLNIMNPAPFSIPVKEFIGAVSIFKNNQWVHVGNTDPVSTSIVPGQNTINLIAHLSIENLVGAVGTNAGAIFNNLIKTITNGSALAQFKIDVLTNIAGFHIESSDQVEISLNTLLNG